MVIKQVKQWMKLRANTAAWRGIMDWAQEQGGRFETMEEVDGFGIDLPKARAGRLHVEWGPSQRAYIPGQELRLRWEWGLHSDLQLMVMERALCDTLERRVYEAFTDTLQTRIDTDTPEEMRWLVMFAQFDQWKSKLARARFTACAVTKEVAAAWVDGALSEALTLASQDLVPAGHAFVLLVQRGNLYLRSAEPEISLERLKAFVHLAEVAGSQAQRLQKLLDDAGVWAHSTTAGDLPPADGA